MLGCEASTQRAKLASMNSSLAHLDPVATQTICAFAIGGLDPSGGAGLPADIRAMRAFDVYCCGITSAVVAQNTRGVAQLESVSATLLAAQLDNLLDDIAPRALKIGLLPNVESVRVVAERLKYFEGVPIIVDPVFAPSCGPIFSDQHTIDALCGLILPRAELVAPNLLEAQQLSDLEIGNVAALHQAARDIHQRFGVANVLIKGGHAIEIEHRIGQSEAVDWLYDGQNFRDFRAPFQSGIEVRGTGCLLASAIAAQRARKVLLPTSIEQAKSWLSGQIASAAVIGQGRRVAW